MHLYENKRGSFWSISFGDRRSFFIIMRVYTCYENHLIVSLSNYLRILEIEYADIILNQFECFVKRDDRLCISYLSQFLSPQ